MTSLGPWLGGSRPFDPFSWDVWDPFDFAGNWGLADTSRRRGGGDRDDPAALARTSVDWQETVNAHIFHADIPGVRKEEVKVQIEDNNVLQISGEHTKREEKQDDTWHRLERRRGYFVRRFRLPENANTDDIRCSLENGVLTVTVPKKETTPRQTNVRAIDIQ